MTRLVPTRRGRLAAALLVAAVAVTVGVLVLTRAGDPTAGAAGGDGPVGPLPAPSVSAPAHAQSAEVGDCYVLGSEDATWGMAHLAFVDCATPHHGQLVARKLLSEPTAVDIGHRPADDPFVPAIDFAIESCLMTVWDEPSDEPVGPVLYFPANLVLNGIAEEVMCAREGPELHVGSAAHRTS
jgi:hypothetical protein